MNRLTTFLAGSIAEGTAETDKPRRPQPVLGLVPGLVEKVRRLFSPRDRRLQGARLDRLVEAGALIDMARSLIEFELPGWNFRSLVREGKQWRCSFSRAVSSPVPHVEVVDGADQMLGAAIVRAFVEARGRPRPA